MAKKLTKSYFKDFTHCGDLSCPVNCDENSERVFCEICQKWFHYKCKNLSKKAYLELLASKKSFVCKGTCCQILFPFFNLNQIEFLDLLSVENDTPCKKCKMACLGNGLMNCIQCDVCEHWFHENCANLDYSLECYLYYDLNFICSDKCWLNLLPFHSVAKNSEVPEFHPSKDSYPCKLCRNQCLGFGLMDCIQCSVCQYWIHANCLKLSQEQFEILANDNSEFICSSRCEMMLLPFHSTNFCSVTEPCPSNQNECVENLIVPLSNDCAVSPNSVPCQQNQMSNTYRFNNQSVYFDQFLDINCSYLKPELLNDEYFKSSPSELIVMHNNICSLPANFHKIEELFIGSTYRPNIVALSETKLKSSSVVPPLKGYSFERTDSPTAAGGVGLYLSDSLQYSIRDDLALNLSHCEDLVWIDLKSMVKYSNSNEKSSFFKTHFIH